MFLIVMEKLFLLCLLIIKKIGFLSVKLAGMICYHRGYTRIFEHNFKRITWKVSNFQLHAQKCTTRTFFFWNLRTKIK